MKNFKEKSIILTTSLFFIVASFSLACVENKRTDKDTGRNWWSLYFVEPKTENMEFAVENHTSTNEFHWEVYLDIQKIQEGDFQIQSGSKNIFTDLSTEFDNIGEQKVTMKITRKGAEEEKNIYKVFSK